MDVLSIAVLSGISFGMVLFLIASGLSLIMGLMGIMNIAHGAIYMVGGYIAVTVGDATGSFLLAILAGSVSAGILGLFMERGFLRNLYGKALDQILVSFAFVYILTNVTLWLWGPYPKTLVVPSTLTNSIFIGVFGFPLHRFLIIGVGIIVCALLWYLQDRTRMGAIVRAGMADAQMVSVLGINLLPITIGLFTLGSLLAGFACVIGMPMLGAVNTEVGASIIFTAIAVVIVGGVGSVQGTLAGALLIGLVYNLTATYFPPMAKFTPYIAMILILLLRPSGLLGRNLGREF